MLTEVWDRTLGLLHRRFVTNALLPVMLLPPAVAVITLLGSGRLGVVVGRAETLPVGPVALAVAGYLLGSWFVAAFVQSQWHNIIRLLEGYPLHRVPRVYAYAKEVHQRRLADIQDDDALQHLQYYRYPLDMEDVLPTTLGNTLRAAERYSFDRYRADSIIWWPRLAALVPPSFAAQLDEFRAGMEFLAVVCVWSTLFTIATSAALLAMGGSPWMFAAVMLLGAAAAAAAYRGTVEAAEEYGEQLRVAHDLYRNLLFTQFRLPVPATLEDERTQWLAMEAFIYANAVHSIDFVDGAPTHGEPT